MPFLVLSPHLSLYDLRVEILAYNSGVLVRYGERVHPNQGMTLLLVPTVILVKDKQTNEELAAWLRDFNNGVLSRSCGIVKKKRLN